MPKILIAPIAILIATVMIGLPVLQILTDDDGESTRSRAAHDARGQVAVLFASAVLESRSATIAARYSVPEIRDQVNAVIIGLQQREPGDLLGAVARTSRIACDDAGVDEECFVARLARVGEEPLVEIPFVVGIVDGAARVVRIGESELALLGRHGRSG